ncbi:hypothetical protein PQX77_006702 [Marasmius sp. AFHP31]|nr:hypothetical protein PQX77_006702 [Marasmius sp. AFHP31]
MSTRRLPSPTYSFEDISPKVLAAAGAAEAAGENMPTAGAEESIAQQTATPLSSPPKRRIRLTGAADLSVRRVAEERACSAAEQPLQPTIQLHVPTSSSAHQVNRTSPGPFGPTPPPPHVHGPHGPTPAPSGSLGPVAASPSPYGPPVASVPYTPPPAGFPPPHAASHPIGNHYGFLADPNAPQHYGYPNAPYTYLGQNTGYVGPPLHFPGLAQPPPAATPPTAIGGPSEQPTAAVPPVVACSPEPSTAAQPSTSDSGAALVADVDDNKENVQPSGLPKADRGNEVEYEGEDGKEETLLGSEGLPGLDQEEGEGDEEE